MADKMLYLKMEEVVAPKLGFRNSAKTFFQNLEKKKPIDVKLDFKGVKFMSRSFAHEYLQRKRESKKRIIETNLPTNVNQMFFYVKDSMKNPHKKQVEPIRMTLS